MGESVSTVLPSGAARGKRYEALEEYAKAERYYLRGVGPEVLVDLARVRLTGEDEGQAASERTPRGLADTTRLRLRAAYADALALLETAPDSASERLALSRSSTLTPCSCTIG